jgi:hypothetical protein
VIVGLLAGFSAHQLRSLLERHVPALDGAFPLACYILGGLVVTLVYGILYGPLRAFDILKVFATVGIGTALGWMYDIISH